MKGLLTLALIDQGFQRAHHLSQSFEKEPKAVSGLRGKYCDELAVPTTADRGQHRATWSSPLSPQTSLQCNFQEQKENKAHSSYVLNIQRRVR